MRRAAELQRRGDPSGFLSLMLFIWFLKVRKLSQQNRAARQLLSPETPPLVLKAHLIGQKLLWGGVGPWTKA